MKAMCCVWQAKKFIIACLSIINQQSQHATDLSFWLSVLFVHYCALSVDGEDDGEDNVTHEHVP